MRNVQTDEMIMLVVAGTDRVGFHPAHDQELLRGESLDIVRPVVIGDGKDVVAPLTILLHPLIDGDLAVGSRGVGMKIGLVPTSVVLKRIHDSHLHSFRDHEFHELYELYE